MEFEDIPLILELLVLDCMGPNTEKEKASMAAKLLFRGKLFPLRAVRRKDCTLAHRDVRTPF